MGNYVSMSTGVVAVVAGIIYTVIPKSASGKNPFAHDTRKKLMPYVFDQRRRDNILKNGYTEKKLQQIGTDFDAIVIGSGIGGLVAASLLARTGKRVLILEQHDQIGGCCHSFRENGFEFDTGIHYIGEMRNNTAFRFLLDQISNGQLSWADVCDDFDTVVLVDDDGDCANGLRKVVEAVEQGQMLKARWIPFRSSRERTTKSLLEAFPDEKAAIDRYFELIEETRKSMRGFVGMKAMPAWLGSLLVNTGLVSFYTDYFLKAQKSVTEVIGSVTENTALRAVLSYNFGDYGTIPKDAPFGMHAALQNHFLHGVSFPVGGSSQIGFTIVPTILEAGGAAFVRAEVESIVTDSTGSVATGVKMKRDGNIISAPIIISDAGLFNTVTKLLSPSAAPKLDSMMRHVRHGTGGLSVYVGLKGTAAALGIEGKHYWAMWTKSGQEDLDDITEKYMNRSHKDLATGPVPLLFISFPSAKDPLWEIKHPGLSTATIVTFANYAWFREWEDERVLHRGAKYENLKKALGDLIWKQTLALFPQLEGKVEYFDVGTPITNKYYLAAARGEMYGCDHNVARFSPQATIDLRPQTAIKNLYLTGQDVFNCGFAGASFGGVFCASAVLKRNVYADLQNLKKKSPPSIPK